MPRDGSNQYHYPPGTPGSPNTTIASNPYNLFISDIEKDQNDPRPVVAGGTGAGTAPAARVNLGTEVSAQVVVDYATHPWENGSFYSAVGATAAPPAAAGQVAVHTFGGITYALDANNRTVVARDLQDTVVPGRTYIREKKAGVWGNWTLEAQSTFDDKVSKLPAGDTMQGDLTIAKANAALKLVKAASGQASMIQGMGPASAQRWTLELGSTDAEDGVAANATGSSLVLHRYRNDGGYLGQAININRSTGIMSAVDGSGAFGPVAGKAYADTKFPTTGGIMTGSLYIQAVSASLNLDDTGTGGAASLYGKTRGLNAWQLNLAGDYDNGSFQFIRFNPLGSAIDVPLHLNRLTGRVTVGAAGLQVNGPTTITGTATTAAINATGDLFITKALPQVVLNRVDNSNAGIIGQRSGSFRWQMDLGESGAESSTASGSDFVWHRFNNAGTYLGAAMRLDRPTASLTVAGVVSPNGYICRAGVGGGVSNVFNIYWSSPNAPLYIDGSLMGNLTYTSDYRVKENVIDLTTMVDRVKALRPISFSYADYMPPWEMDAQQQRRQRVIDDLADKARAAAVAAGADIDGAIAAADEARAKAEVEVGEPGPFMVKDTREQWGFIAHELQQTLIETAATGEKDAEGIIQSPNPWTVIAALTKALQEMIARVEALENAP
jgi:hypothetical protein